MANNKAFKVKNGLELEAYSKAISDTAVDIFVYDTRKDSDGGAWRKRTQHTSWYNEAASSTRGSRKEFPAVAVIVAETTQVTIYDGDDPDLPMWMVFNRAGDSYFASSSTLCTSVVFFNSLLVFGVGTGTREISFLKDSALFRTNSGKNKLSQPISGRNSGNAGLGYDGDPLVNSAVNDVAMTVLPNAPIDAATGLPVPTIAVATDGGVSVIKDDGSVVSDSTIDGITPYVGSVAFWNNETLAVQYGYASTDDFTRIRTFSYPAMTEQYQYRASQDYSGYMGAATNWTESLTNTPAIGSEYGAILLDREDDPSEVTTANKMVAQVASSYNTGWMNGAIKLATLSDTDDTNVTGSELVTNGDGSTTTGWTAQNATLSIVSGSLRVADNGVYSKAYQAITTEVGKTYVFSVNIIAISGSNAVISIGNNTPSTGAWNDYFASHSTTGVKTITYTAESTTTYIELGSESTHSVDYDNISVRLAEEDRSVNGNGLQVFGTVTKSAVATGADLVGYSGFSSSNYLAQPYNSDIDVGTGDFSFSIWAKANAFNSYNVLFANWWLNNNNAAQFTLETIGTKIWFYVVDGGAFHAAGGNTDLSVGVWNHITVTRQNSLMTVYINGVPESTTYRYTGDLIARTSPLSIGVLWSNTGPSGGADGPWNGSLALFRMSATAPSPEQIKKIYEDEKVLFQDNAQATLYGSSDAVTALAYDDTTELLHVGTSAGRSVFQGLRRVDNTTTAVSAAISASNNLVGEQ